METQLNDTYGVRINHLEAMQLKHDTQMEKMNDDITQIKVDHADLSAKILSVNKDISMSLKKSEEYSQKTNTVMSELSQAIRESNQKYDSKFDDIDSEVDELKTNYRSQSLLITSDLEKKKLSNGVIITIIAGGFSVIQFFIQFIGPMLFK